MQVCLPTMVVLAALFLLPVDCPQVQLVQVVIKFGPVEIAFMQQVLLCICLVVHLLNQHLVQSLLPRQMLELQELVVL